MTTTEQQRKRIAGQIIGLMHREFLFCKNPIRLSQQTFRDLVGKEISTEFLQTLELKICAKESESKL